MSTSVYLFLLKCLRPEKYRERVGATETFFARAHTVCK